MQQVLIDFIKGFDIQTIISMVVVFWFMTKGIRDDIKEMKKEISYIKEDLKDLDRRLCRIEGAITSKDCSMLKNEDRMKNVE